MRLAHKYIQRIVILLAVSILLLSTVAYAAPTFEHPSLYVSGDYEYIDVSHQLNISNMEIDFAESAPFVSDYVELLGKSITIGSLYNSDADPYTFGGSTSFEIEDNLTATLDNFFVENTLGTRVELGSIYDINKTGTSPYLAAIGRNDLNLYISFTSDEGVETFDESSYGTGSFQGEIRVAVAPEPASTFLFIVGGITLAFSRRFKKKN